MPGEDPRDAGNAVSGGQKDSSPRVATPIRVSMRRALTRVSAFALAGGLGVAEVLAQEPEAALPHFPMLSTPEVLQLAIVAGVLLATFLTAITLIRDRARISTENADIKTRLAESTAIVRRYEALMSFRDQRTIVWASDAKKADIVGALPAESGAPEDRAQFLAFGRWLNPQSAAMLDQATAALREHRRNFDLMAETQNGSVLEVQGRYTPASVLVRFIALSASQQAQARLRLENQKLVSDYYDLLSMMDGLEMPAWIRGHDGKLKWVNRAYADAVEAADSEAAVHSSRELLGTQVREEIAIKHRTAALYRDDISTVMHGDRHMMSVVDFAGTNGGAGLARDISDLEMLRDKLKRAEQNHVETLNHLMTAVAIFDAQQKLRFYNNAFQLLWDIDPAYLDTAPENALLLDHLRSLGKLGERPDWRGWKEGILAAYRAVDPKEDLWHLPDGRTLRVVGSPQANGGVTWVFENLTEQMQLQSRYATEVRVRGETLDNLAEGVAVFGHDGKIKLFNPAFLRFWEIEPGTLQIDTHISALRARSDAVAKDSPWSELMADITGFDAERRDRQGQTELIDGKVLRYAVISLPNQQVMVTFIDMTDSVNVERALHEKNDALQRAYRLKNDFVQHISYELRTPLTNIRGFAEVLAMGQTGELNERQREYIDHINASSVVLSETIDDILDLATVDAGFMQLDMAEVPIGQAIDAAAALISDRLAEHHIALKLETKAAPRTFYGDEMRVRQVLYNLLSNAANFAPPESTITLACRQVHNGVEFSVHDDGPGMSEEMLGVVFSRFEARANGGRRRGAGLGLSIVKSFVELHGGTVKIETGSGKGTTVICFFPFPPDGGIREAAE
ncbi:MULTISPECIES: sensor histidine kinase [Mesorhizobium]|uniref:histidine kinase n=1 Tax=Mesorhizobium denitrificans TaxID=2294114 RepID=A0A371XH65_9HYPH|nr:MULTISPECIES: PAS domain-containing sensor histidine kinase [Mesorhizobium]RFC68568.1 PAS domain-containing protein [Mesorhizobium denitrificans]